MDRLRDLNLSLGYSSSTDNLLQEFYVPCLSASGRYLRSAGFFSSAIFALAPLAFADFVSREGKIRMICSPKLSPQDIKAFEQSSNKEDFSIDALRSEISELIQDPVSLDLVGFTSALIRSGALEVRICVPNSGMQHAIFHDKVGIFSDNLNSVMFLGSANETAMAWSPHGNHESIEVMKSWIPSDRERIARHERYFERLWAGASRNWRTLPIERANFEILNATEEISVTEAMERVRLRVHNDDVDPPREGRDRVSLLPYQEQVLDNWRAKNRGIVTFATGGGKTFVGLTAVDDHAKDGGPSLILVPTTDLQRQWQKEIESHFPELASRVISVGGGSRWRSLTQQMNTIFATKQSHSGWTFISTYQSAVVDDFLDLAHLAPDLLVVADEVHNAGTPTFRKFLERVNAHKRLGLSATPDRYGDPDGTNRIYDYFGTALDPAFTIADGISCKRLTPYTYDYAIVHLTEEEQESWDVLTARIRVFEARIHSGDRDVIEARNRLLQERSRIAKKAHGKVPVGIQILHRDLKLDQRWLIYCQDTEQLNEMKQATKDAFPKIPTLPFHSQMSRDERRSTLDFFANNPSIICAINCLDEGIDVPAADAALVLASSTNPRQYIQRRGRILRASSGRIKGVATLRDLIVVSNDGRLLTLSEAERARAFASDSYSFSVHARLGALIEASGLDSISSDAHEDEAGGEELDD